MVIFLSFGFNVYGDRVADFDKHMGGATKQQAKPKAAKKTKKASEIIPAQVVYLAEITDSITGMELKHVPKGCYQMGDTFGDGLNDEKPVHQVCVNNFYIGKYEVTVGQYLKFAKETGSHYPEWLESGSKYNIDTGTDDYYKKVGMSRTADNYPIVGVSWNDADAYAKWLSRKSGKTYRLPTEAEWEYAARSGGRSEKWSGTSSESSLGEYAWYDKNAGGKTHPVGQKRPNGLAIYDMSGNVWEWCADWYGEKYYSQSSRDNPRGPSGDSGRVGRGGSWDVNASYCRAANRSGGTPGYRRGYLGFRLARTP